MKDNKINNIIPQINKIITLVIENPVLDNYITKNIKYEKYHVHYPSIVVDLKTRHLIYKIINEFYKYDIIDMTLILTGAGIRTDGFECDTYEYINKIRTLKAHKERYEPVGNFKFDKKFYKSVYPFRSKEEENKLLVDIPEIDTKPLEKKKGSFKRKKEKCMIIFDDEEDYEDEIIANSFSVKKFLKITCKRFNKEIKENMKKTIKMKNNEELKETLKKKNIAKLEEELIILKSKKYKIINEKQKKYFELFHSKIDFPLCYVKNSYNDTYIYKYDKLCELYKTINPDIRSYNTMDFLPYPRKCPKYIYNTFSGLEIDNYKHNCKSVNFDLITEHFSILVNHDEKSLEYLLDYLADLIQNPGLSPRVALLFRSDQGVGKNLIWEDFIGKMLLGLKFMLQTNETEKILGRFSMINNKLLVIMDEVSGKDTFTNNDRIKNLITSQRIAWERKGIDGLTVNNCARFLFFCNPNNTTPIKIEFTDRRFVIFDCDNSKCNNKDYFSKLLKAINDKNVAYSFYQFLMARDLSKWDSINDRPLTSSYKDIQSANIPIVSKFLIDYILNKDNEEKVMGSNLYIKFQSWLGKNGYDKIKYTNTKFGRDLKHYKGIEKARKSQGVSYIFNFEDIKTDLIDKKHLTQEECLIIEDDEE
jgi:hypothetical protein